MHQTRQNQFIDGLAEGMTIGEAAKQAGVSRQRAYQWRALSLDFSRAWDAVYKPPPKPIKINYGQIPKPAYIGDALHTWVHKHELAVHQAANALGMVLGSFNNWYHDYSKCHIIKLVRFRLEAPEAFVQVSPNLKLSVWIIKHSLDKAFAAYTLGITRRTLEVWLAQGEPNYTKHFLKYRLMFDSAIDMPT